MLGLDAAHCRDFGGFLIPRDASSDEHNEARKLKDLAFDAHPGPIAMCTNVDDVGLSIAIAKAGGFAVQAGLAPPASGK